MLNKYQYITGKSLAIWWLHGWRRQGIRIQEVNVCVHSVTWPSASITVKHKWNLVNCTKTSHKWNLGFCYLQILTCIKFHDIFYIFMNVWVCVFKIQWYIFGNLSYWIYLLLSSYRSLHLVRATVIVAYAMICYYALWRSFTGPAI